MKFSIKIYVIDDTNCCFEKNAEKIFSHTDLNQISLDILFLNHKNKTRLRLEYCGSFKKRSSDWVTFTK